MVLVVSVANAIIVCDRSRCYLTYDQQLICQPGACVEIKPPKGTP